MSENSNQPRHERGARIAGRNAGGEWAKKVHSSASGDVLYAGLSQADEQRKAIFEHLRATGSVPATTIESATNPRFTDGIDVWWEQHYERMEQPPAGDAYDIMPDDYTPGRTTGHALSGHRRTHRMRYSGAGVDLRMPSATAIKRFSAENNGRTFDVPVEMAHEGGVISGYVRVTQGAPGAWEVQALNFPGKSAGRVAESVACVLESRRPSMALNQAAAQYAARRELSAQSDLPESGVLEGASPLHQRMINRMARSGATFQKPRVPSSVVREVGYDAATGTMAINLNGRKYAYRVDRATFLAIADGAQPGVAYNQLVKNRAQRVEAVRCRKCRRFSRTSVKHVCPPRKSRPRRKNMFRTQVATLFLSSLSRDQKTA